MVCAKFAQNERQNMVYKFSILIFHVVRLNVTRKVMKRFYGIMITHQPTSFWRSFYLFIYLNFVVFFSNEPISPICWCHNEITQCAKKMSETAVYSEIKDPFSWIIAFFAIDSLHFMILYWSGIADIIAYFFDVTKIQKYLKTEFIGANFVYRHKKIGFTSDDYSVCWKLKGQSRWIKFHWHRMLRTAWQIHQFWYDNVLNLISVIVYVGIFFILCPMYTDM